MGSAREEVELRLLEEAAKAERAKAFQAEVYRDAYDRVRAAIIAAWEDCDQSDAEKQHDLKNMLEALKTIDQVLEGFVQDGVVAQIQLADMAKPR